MVSARNLRQVRRLARVASVGVVVVLVAFHGWLFAGRVAGGELLEPAVALRWLASLVLVGALLALRRSGVPLVRGRRALVFWVAVLLLHWSATPVAERGLEAGELLVTAPGALVLLAGGAWLLAGGGRRRSDRPARRPAPVPGVAFSAPTAARLIPALAPRPPPA